MFARKLAARSHLTNIPRPSPSLSIIKPAVTSWKHGSCRCQGISPNWSATSTQNTCEPHGQALSDRWANSFRVTAIRIRARQTMSPPRSQSCPSSVRSAQCSVADPTAKLSRWAGCTAFSACPRNNGSVLTIECPIPGVERSRSSIASRSANAALLSHDAAV